MMSLEQSAGWIPSTASLMPPTTVFVASRRGVGCLLTQIQLPLMQVNIRILEEPNGVLQPLASMMYRLQSL